jgi:hypothetical protein
MKTSKLWLHEFSMLATDEVNDELHAQYVLPPGEIVPRYHLNRSLDGPRISSGRCGEDEDPLSFVGIQPRLVIRIQL